MLAPLRPIASTPTSAERLRFVLAHAVLPLAVLALTAGTLVWGPYMALVLTVLTWRFVTRLA